MKDASAGRTQTLAVVEHDEKHRVVRHTDPGGRHTDYRMELLGDEHDLVVSTYGRGVYILDDYTPLRGLTAKTLAAPRYDAPAIVWEGEDGAASTWTFADLDLERLEADRMRQNSFGESARRHAAATNSARLSRPSARSASPAAQRWATTSCLAGRWACRVT